MQSIRANRLPLAALVALLACAPASVMARAADPGLIEAVKAGKVETVRALLERGA